MRHFTNVLLFCFTALFYIVSADWSGWTVWSACSQTCNHGTKTRDRTCNEPLIGCVGDHTESIICLVQMCPVDPLWTIWGPWTECTSTCTPSERSHTRYCAASVCPPGGSQTEAIPCTKCVMDDCFSTTPGNLDCNFESECTWNHDAIKWKIGTTTPSVHSGPIIDHTFSEECGHFIYLDSTQLSPNEVSIIQTPLQAASSTKKCLSFYLSMYALYADSMGSLSVIVQFQDNTEMTLWHHDKTLVTNNPTTWLPVNVHFQPNGRQYTIQLSAKRGGIYSDIAIDDIRLTDGDCDGPVDGNWTPWTDYGNCNVSCGVGERMRKRTCTSPVPSIYGGQCHGENEQSTPCIDLPLCQVNGNWRDWSQWTVCSTDCGKQTRTKTRYCDMPKPVAGGLYCTLLQPNNGVVRGLGETAVEDCFPLVECPINGEWGEWTDTSICSTTCGLGSFTQERICGSPAPFAGGDECDLIGGGTALTETITKGCNRRNCEVDGVWGVWSEWSADDACGWVSRQRTRQCDSPPPDYGGTICASGGGTAYVELESDTLFQVPGTGPIKAIRYNNICNRQEIAALQSYQIFPEYPDICYRLNDFNSEELSRDIGEKFGIKMWTYFTAPDNGAYIFAASCNRFCNVYISTDTDPANKGTEVIMIDETNIPLNDYNKYPPKQIAAAITMVAGTKYYVELVGNEGTNNEHFQLGVTLPGGGVEHPITSQYLSDTP